MEIGSEYESPRTVTSQVDRARLQHSVEFSTLAKREKAREQKASV
jgi:hypothetical protein